MLYSALYLTFIILELILFISLALYVISLIYSWLKGAPYVGTQDKEIGSILSQANLKPGTIFLELGCGDGRVVRSAVKNYKVIGIGVDINPLLILYCKLISKLQGIHTIQFQSKNILEINLDNADVIYIYLFPALVEKIKKKLLKINRKNVTIISHGFKINYLSSYLLSSRKGTKFTTYYYRMNT